MAARLEKIPGATFAFNIRGFSLEDENVTEFFKSRLTVKKMSVRGIGEGELVALRKDEYQAMKASDKRLFKDI